MAKKAKPKTNVENKALPTFQLTELAYSLRIINSDYEGWCNKPLPTEYPE